MLLTKGSKIIIVSSPSVAQIKRAKFSRIRRSGNGARFPASGGRRALSAGGARLLRTGGGPGAA